MHGHLSDNIGVIDVRAVTFGGSTSTETVHTEVTTSFKLTRLAVRSSTGRSNNTNKRYNFTQNKYLTFQSSEVQSQKREKKRNRIQNVGERRQDTRETSSYRRRTK